MRLLDGKLLDGRARFDPDRPDVDFETNGVRRPVPAERIAWIAFRGKPAATGGSSLRVHVREGESFEVVPGASTPVGFWGTPTDPASPYEQIFFYTHGVRAKEDPAPIGELLVKQGSIKPAQLEAGLAAQAEARRVPLGQILIEQHRIASTAIDEAARLQQRRKLRIGEVLVDEGLASREQVEKALEEQKRRRGRRLGVVLVEMGVVDEATLTATLAKKFEMQHVDLDALPDPPLDPGLIELVRRFGVLPLQSDSLGVVLAIGDPLGMDAVDAFRFQTQKRVTEVLARPTQLTRAVERYLERAERSALDARVDEILQELQDDVPSAAEAADARLNEADSGVIKLVNQILLDAVRRGASDIHIEPNGRSRPTMVRFRVDGDCVAYQEIPAAYRAAIVSRLKVMAKLDLAERRRPQDGKIRFGARERTIELRIATIPTIDDGEDVVLRILAGSRPMALDSCGFTPRDLREVRAAIAQPHGLVLCVGPTGSGKTTTLHSLLGAINTSDLKIWTAEDPVEITQPGLRQVQVQPKIGMSFAAVLRAFLRADPDVIMVGEMRDLETATIAIEASLTGHLVFSTLHTNSAPETITRLVDMGVDPFILSDALRVVIAQRLVRSLCRMCREPFEVSGREREELAALFGTGFEERFGKQPKALYRPKGCADCRGSGYKGRLALHEVLVADDALRFAIQKKQTAESIRSLAVSAGMTRLLQAGIAHVVGGETDLNQVLSVCGR